MSTAKRKPALPVPVERIEQGILLLRGQRVMLDEDLAEIDGVTTERRNEQVRCNKGRFPEDFMFHLTKEEFANLRSQFATSRFMKLMEPPPGKPKARIGFK